MGYLDRPDLDPCLDFVWDAFQVLTSDRSLGMTEGPIPFSSIEQFASRYGIDDLEAFDDFQSMIAGMDREYLKIRAQQASENTPDSKRNTPV